MRTEKNDNVVDSISPDLRETEVTVTELVGREKNNTSVMVPLILLKILTMSHRVWIIL